MSLAAPRAGQIESLLAGQLPGATGASVRNVSRIFGGNARIAWTFDATCAGGDGPTEIAGILLAQPPGGQLDSDPEREYRVLRGLAGGDVRVPAALAVDPDGSTIGAPAVLLERIAGTGRLTAFLRPDDPADTRAVTEDLAVAAAELHAADWRSTGLGSPEDGRSARDVAMAQVDHWESEFRDARLEPHPPLSAVFAWLRAHLPEPAALGVVHGDLRAGNFLHQDGRVTALLDWEMAHLGDPAEDLAWVYRPLWSPDRFVALESFLEIYNAHAPTPVDADRLAYYRVFNEAKFSAISMSAAHAFHSGESRNLRLADRAAMVNGCVSQAFRWMEELDARA
jgi:aminoglycoside phosphotransferase (APT) family kinase protein